MAQSQGISFQRQIRVTRQGLLTVSMWFRSRFLTLGPTLDPCCHRKMLMTDASLMGWGAALVGCPAQGIWRGHLLELAHQLPRNEDCISGPEILPPAVERLPCPSAGGQHICSLLHKSPGQTAVAPLGRVSAPGSALGTGKVPVPQGDLHSWAYECGSRLAVQTSCETREMETPPLSSQI